MSFEETLKPIAKILEENAKVSFVFGRIQEIKGRSFIPVSAVRYGFGAGSGKKRSSSEDGKPDEGKGGGGGLENTPLGVFEITDDITTFKPVINFNNIFKIVIFWMVISFLKKLFLKK